MRVLLLTKSVPYPLDQGANLRNFHLIKNLSRRHEIYLLSIARSDNEVLNAKFLEPFCKQITTVRADRSTVIKATDVLRSIFGGRPYTVLANTVAGVSDAIRTILASNEIDVIQVQELYLAGNLDGIPRKTPVVLDAFNMEGMLLRRLAMSERRIVPRIWHQMQAARMEAYEREVSPLVDALWAVTPAECDYFRSLNPQTFYVPNGVELPAELISDSNTKRISAGPLQQNTLFFTGFLQYPPNLNGLLWFLQEIWPKLSAINPELRFAVVARRPPSSVRRYESDRITFYDNINEIEPFFSSASALVVPLLAGAGTKLKILQAFAAGLPVISTAIGSEGLQAIHEQHLLVANSPGEFASAVERVLKTPGLSSALAKNAAEFVRDRYDWSKIVESCFDCYESVHKNWRVFSTAKA